MLEEFVAFILLKIKKKRKTIEYVVHLWNDYLNNVVKLMVFLMFLEK